MVLHGWKIDTHLVEAGPRCAIGVGLGPGVSPSDGAPIASCHVNAKCCGNCEHCDQEEQLAIVYSL